MAKFKAARGKARSRGPTPPPGGVACVIIVIAGMLLVMLFMYFVLKNANG